MCHLYLIYQTISIGAATTQPTDAPVTAAPVTNSPVTSSPSRGPSTSSPSKSPSLSPVTPSPTTSDPTVSPSQSPETSSPSKSPSLSPVTSDPTTLYPTLSPSKSPSPAPSLSLAPPSTYYEYTTDSTSCNGGQDYNIQGPAPFVNKSNVALQFFAFGDTPYDDISNTCIENGIHVEDCALYTCTVSNSDLDSLPVNNTCTYKGLHFACLKNSILPSKRSRIEHISSKEMVQALQAAVESVGEDKLGIKKEDVGTHSIRSGAAMAMYLGECPVFTIMMIGRWSSDAFLRYIRKQVEQFSHGIAKRMIKNQFFRHIPDVPRVSRLDSRHQTHTN